MRGCTDRNARCSGRCRRSSGRKWSGPERTRWCTSSVSRPGRRRRPRCSHRNGPRRRSDQRTRQSTESCPLGIRSDRRHTVPGRRRSWHRLRSARDSWRRPRRHCCTRSRSHTEWFRCCRPSKVPHWHQHPPPRAASLRTSLHSPAGRWSAAPRSTQCPNRASFSPVPCPSLMIELRALADPLACGLGSAAAGRSACLPRSRKWKHTTVGITYIGPKTLGVSEYPRTLQQRRSSVGHAVFHARLCFDACGSAPGARPALRAGQDPDSGQRDSGTLRPEWDGPLGGGRGRG